MIISKENKANTPDIIPFPEKILVSCVTKNKGPLTKIMRIDPETKQLVKDGSECSMSTGTMETIEVSSPDGFSRLLRSREENQALVHGISQHEVANIVTKGKVDKYPKNGTPVIARTKDFITYPDSPGVVLFDHDKARELSVGSGSALKAYSPQELLGLLATVHPETARAAFVSTPSTSSCIYAPDGSLLSGEGTGSHVYLFVKRASDIPRYLETFGKHLFLASHGRLEISRSGALLKRTLIDLVVGSPERLDFVAGCVCEDGLSQKLPDPVVHNGDMLDTATLKNLTPEQEIQYLKVVADLTEQAKPNQAKVVAEYIEKESAKLAATRNISITDARRVVASRQDHVLADDDVLYFSHLKEGVAVSDVLTAGKSFHGKSLADPLEPDYEGGSKTKAKFFWNDGSPIIHSYAHGSTKYKFEQFKKAPKEQPPQDHVPWFEEALGNGSVSRFLDSNPPALDWIFEGSLLARTTGMLVGPGAAGKSTLAILMLIAVATGRDILPGIFTPTMPGKALGVFGEDDEIILHHRIHTMVNQLFAHDREAQTLLRQNLIIVTTTGQDVRFLDQATKNLGESDFFAEVFSTVKKVDGLRLIVLDPVSRFHGAEENDNGAGTFLVSLMERIAQETGAAVLSLHHVGKRAGINQQGFDLDAAMHQDSARGASGLTNGVRWQCNLFGLPEKECKRLIGVKDARPGQYLAIKVSKKNYGSPEKVNFLERQAGGVMRPFEPINKEIDRDLGESIRQLILDAVLMNEGKQLTKRILIDGNHPAWKKDNPHITRLAVEQTLASCLLQGELFGRPGKNTSGRSITYLSRYPEPSANLKLETGKNGDLEPEIEPEIFEPENRKQPEEREFTDYNALNLNDKLEPEILNCKNPPFRFVTPRNCETVEPEISSPYGGDKTPSGSHRGDIPQLSEEDANAEYF